MQINQDALALQENFDRLRLRLEWIIFCLVDTALLVVAARILEMIIFYSDRLLSWRFQDIFLVLLWCFAWSALCQTQASRICIYCFCFKVCSNKQMLDDNLIEKMLDVVPHYCLRPSSYPMLAPVWRKALSGCCRSDNIKPDGVLSPLCR